MVSCPYCNSKELIKYGKTRAGTQNFYCKSCNRKTSANPKKMFKNDHIICPRCGGKTITKKGFTGGGTQKYYCKDCFKRFCINPIDRSLNKDEKLIIIRYAKCLGLPIKEVAKHLGRSQTTVRNFFNSIK